MPAVTVALWGAVLADHEERRARERSWRREQVIAALVADGVCDEAQAASIWDQALTTFRATWQDQHHTPGLAYCLGEGLAAHGLLPGPTFDHLVADIETRALDDLPPLVPGAREALAELSARWPLGVLCDVQVTPAPVLRDCLDALDLSRYFDACVFSDEVGAAKPMRAGFRVASEEIGVLLADLVHIGTSEARDVVGAQAAGARAILLDATGSCPDSDADACCPDLRSSVDHVAQLFTV